MKAPVLASRAIDTYRPPQLNAVLDDPRSSDSAFADAAAALTFLESLIVKVPRHRLRRGWRVVVAGEVW